jgi:hypothetical protein
VFEFLAGVFEKINYALSAAGGTLKAVFGVAAVALIVGGLTKIVMGIGRMTASLWGAVSAQNALNASRMRGMGGGFVPMGGGGVPYRPGMGPTRGAPAGGGGRMGRFGGGMAGFGAGLGLSLLGGAIKGDSKAGSTRNTLGTAASYAGTGAMLGSMFGPGGALIGGLAGGIAGLGKGIGSSLGLWQDGGDNIEGLGVVGDGPKSQNKPELVAMPPHSNVISNRNIKSATNAKMASTMATAALMASMPGMMGKALEGAVSKIPQSGGGDVILDGRKVGKFAQESVFGNSRTSPAEYPVKAT